MLMLPELIVIAAAFAVLVLDLFAGPALRRRLPLISLAGLAAAAAAVIALMPQSGQMLGGRFAVDSVGWWFKLIFLFAAFVTVVLSMDEPSARAAKTVPLLESPSEYHTILLFTLAGMLYLVSARDLITLYLSLELSTVLLFGLSAWRRDSLGGEAGLKYAIIGALASGALLYGMSLLYGLTGETDLQRLGAALQPSAALWVAIAMVAVGAGFKLTMVPFHGWAADVYQGAPTPITAYLSVASKFAGLAVVFQFFYRVFTPYLPDCTLAIALFATATMTLGNLVAVVQDNIKRFMAFSAISQAGYLLIGLLGPSSQGITAIVFYMLVYAVANLAAFAVIVWHGNRTGGEQIADFRGLSRTNPLMALAMMVALFGLAGIPPLSGFVGKFFLFSVAAREGLHWLVAVAAVNSTISLYYYLRIVRQMYIEKPDADAASLPVSRAMGALVGITVAASVVIGIIPQVYGLIDTQTGGWLAGLSLALR